MGPLDTAGAGAKCLVWTPGPPGQRRPAAVSHNGGVFARWLRWRPRNYLSQTDGRSRAVQPVRGSGRSPFCPRARSPHPGSAWPCLGKASSWSRPSWDAPHPPTFAAMVLRRSRTERLLRTRRRDRVRFIPRAPATLARSPPASRKARAPSFWTRGCHLVILLRAASGEPGRAPLQRPVLCPPRPRLSRLVACFPGADSPFWSEPVTPGKHPGKGDGCWLLESNGPCSGPAAWPWEVTTLSEPGLVDRGAGAQVGSERSSQFLVKLPGKQAQSSSRVRSVGRWEPAPPAGPAPPGRQGLGLKVPPV